MSIVNGPAADNQRLPRPQLGVEVSEQPLGSLIRADVNNMTSVTGVYAAGDIARAPHSVSWAAADGVTAGTSVSRALVFG